MSTNQRPGLGETQARTCWGQPAQADNSQELVPKEKNMCEEFSEEMISAVMCFRIFHKDNNFPPSVSEKCSGFRAKDNSFEIGTIDHHVLNVLCPVEILTKSQK